MNRQSLPAMIRDLLTTGDMESRLNNAEWLTNLVNQYAPSHDEVMATLLDLPDQSDSEGVPA